MTTTLNKTNSQSKLITVTSTCSNFDDFNPNNIVMVVRWDSEISLNDAFKCLPILVIDDVPKITKKKGKKVKIPFYGSEDTIVSIRYKKESRGLRNVSSQMDNFVSVDLQTSCKNVHIKLSTTNANVMGVTSIEQGLDAVECLLDIINMTDDNLTYLRKSDSNAVDNCLNFIKSLSKDGNISINLPDYEEFMLLVEIFNNNTNNSYVLDARLCQILLAYAYESTKYSKFIATIDNITNCSKINSNNVKPKIYDVSNSAYNYKLKINKSESDQDKQGVFILSQLASCIDSFQLVSVVASHHNWHSKYVNVVISEKVELEGGGLGKRIHRFNVSEKGSIRQWSPSSREDAFQIHNKFLKIIKMALQENSEILEYLD